MTDARICSWCKGCACAPFVNQEGLLLEVCFGCLEGYFDPSESHYLFSYQACASCGTWFRQLERVLASRPERVSAAESLRDTLNPRCPDCDVSADPVGQVWLKCPECGVEFRQVSNVA